MLLEFERARIQVDVIGAHHIGESLGGFHDPGFDQALANGKRVLAGFHGETHLPAARALIVLGETFVHLILCTNGTETTYTEICRGADQPQHNNNRQRNQPMLTLLLLAPLAHLTTGFRRFRRLGDGSRRIARHPLRVFFEVIVERIGHYFSLLFLLSNAACKITTADC